MQTLGQLAILLLQAIRSTVAIIKTTDRNDAISNELYIMLQAKMEALVKELEDSREIIKHDKATIYERDSKIDELMYKMDEQSRKMDEQSREIAQLLSNTQNISLQLEESHEVVEEISASLSTMSVDRVLRDNKPPGDLERLLIYIVADGLYYYIRAQVKNITHRISTLKKVHPMMHQVFEISYHPNTNALWNDIYARNKSLIIKQRGNLFSITATLDDLKKAIQNEADRRLV